MALTKANLKKLMKDYEAKKAQTGRASETASVGSWRSFSSRGSFRGRGGGPRRGGFGKGNNQQRKARGRFSLLKAGLQKLMPVVKSHLEAKKKLSLMKSGYFVGGKDEKTDMRAAQVEVDQLEKEVQLMVGAIRNGLGDKPIRMRLSSTVEIYTTVTTGVTRDIVLGGSGNSLNPSFCTEWASCAALFEEYKMFGGEAVFTYWNSLNAQGSGNGARIVNNNPVIAYDADDSTVAASSIALTQAAQHEILPNVWSNGTTGGNPIAVGANGGKHKFSFHIPKGDVALQSGSGNAAGTQWNAVATPLSHGFLKFYHVGSEITAVVTGAGVVYFDLEFRCRA